MPEQNEAVEAEAAVVPGVVLAGVSPDMRNRVRACNEVVEEVPTSTDTKLVDANVAPGAEAADEEAAEAEADAKPAADTKPASKSADSKKAAPSEK